MDRQSRSKLLIGLVRLLVTEARVREVDISGGRAIKGSEEHVNDLRERIAHYVEWMNKYPKGSAKREDYARIVRRLKGELKSAERASEKGEM